MTLFAVCLLTHSLTMCSVNSALKIDSPVQLIQKEMGTSRNPC